MVTRFFGQVADASVTSAVIMFDCALWTWNVPAFIRVVHTLR